MNESSSDPTPNATPDSTRGAAEEQSPTSAPASAVTPQSAEASQPRARYRLRYCPACASEMDPRRLSDGQLVLQCPACAYVHYRNSRPTAGAVVVRDGRALFGRRRVAPHAGKWDILGGFLHHGEHPEDGLRRELKEEIGLAVRILRLLGFYMDGYDEDTSLPPDPSAGDDESAAHLMDDAILNIYYLAQAEPGEPQAADDVAELAWFTPDALPDDDEWAFAHQPTVIRDWLALAGLTTPHAATAGSARRQRRRARDQDTPEIDLVAVPPSAADAQAGLAMRAPRTEWHTSIPSTMDRARELAQADMPIDAVVADFQEAGRGTQGRVWQAAPGTCLMATFIGRPARSLEAASLADVPLRIASAITGWMRGAYNVRAEVKPPNDVMVDGRKLCGILCQSHVVGEQVIWVICGIGLNTHMRAGQLPLERATSLALELGADSVPAHARLLQDLYTELTRALPDIFTLTNTPSAAGVGRTSVSGVAGGFGYGTR